VPRRESLIATMASRLKGMSDDAVEKAQHLAHIHAMGIQLLKMRLREDKQHQIEMEKLKCIHVYEYIIC
jgi:hypothetical protein